MAELPRLGLPVPCRAAPCRARAEPSQSEPCRSEPKRAVPSRAFSWRPPVPRVSRSRHGAAAERCAPARRPGKPRGGDRAPVPSLARILPTVEGAPPGPQASPRTLRHGGAEPRSRESPPEPGGTGPGGIAPRPGGSSPKNGASPSHPPLAWCWGGLWGC